MTILLQVKNSGLLKIHGELHGEIKDILIWEDKLEKDQEYVDWHYKQMFQQETRLLKMIWKLLLK